MEVRASISSSELAALVERAVAAAENRLRTELGQAASLRVDELHRRLAEQEATINQLVSSSKEVYEASSQAMRTLVADLTVRGAEQDKDRKRVDALEQRVAAQEEALSTLRATQEMVRTRCDAITNSDVDSGSIHDRLSAVEAKLERLLVHAETQLGPPSRERMAVPALHGGSPKLDADAAMAAAVAGPALDAGSPQLNECSTALSPSLDDRHEHGPIAPSPRLELRSSTSEAVPSVPGSNLLHCDNGSDGLDSDAYRHLLPAGTDKADAAGASAATSVKEGAAEVDKSAAKQATMAASDAVKVETEELAGLVVSLLTGCRTELKRLADAFAVMRTRRQTSDQAIRSLAQKLQAMQKQDATETLANHRRIGGLCAAIETLATEVDSGFDDVAQQLSHAGRLSDPSNRPPSLRDIGSQSMRIAQMNPRDAYKKVKRLLPPTDTPLGA